MDEEVKEIKLTEEEIKDLNITYSKIMDLYDLRIKILDFVIEPSEESKNNEVKLIDIFESIEFIDSKIS